MSRKRKQQRKKEQRRRRSKTAGASSPAESAATQGGVAAVEKGLSVGPKEFWTKVAFIPGLLLITLVLYLGSKPGGSTPIDLYNRGPVILVMVAFLLLVVGIGWSLTHRPFLQQQRVWPFVALAGTVGFGSYPFPYPTSYAERTGSVVFDLPVQGEWLVRWGGESWRENAYRLFPDRCRAVVLEALPTESEDEGGRASSATTTGEFADFPSYGRRVFAPADAMVAAALDELPDRSRGAGFERGRELGNYIVLEVAPMEFLFLSNLAPGSLLAGPGERVTRGQELARVGNSAHSPVDRDPHLSMHLQDTPVPGRGEGIPMRFGSYSTDRVGGAHGLLRGGVNDEGQKVGERIRPLPELGAERQLGAE